MKYKMNRIKYAIIILAAYLNLAALQYVSGLSGFTGVYLGTGIFSFMPESLIIFGVSIFLLKRFTDETVLHDGKRIIFSGIFGFMLGFACVWGQEILYEITLFQSFERTIKAFLAAFGISFFTIPFTSEMIGLCKKLSQKTAETAGTENYISRKHRFLYFICLFLAAFCCFVPLFLYVWPMNLYGDSLDELCSQLLGYRNTHYPVLHGLLMRIFYNWGLKHESPAFGLQFLTLLQMAVLAASIACFSLYLYDKRVNRIIRIFLFLLSVLNPVNSYYAVTAEKGTIGIALAFIGMIFLLRILDYCRGRETVYGKQVLILAVCFIIFSSVGCFFRNNMIYAFLAGGLVISILQKGWKKKLLMFLIFIFLMGSYKAEEHILYKIEKPATTDRYQETFPFPIMALSRIAILHKEEMDPVLYQTITAFIPEEALGGYSISTADSIKSNAREELLEKETILFLKIFVKGAFLYPGDYLDQLGWLTYGYWEPYHAFVLGSTAPLIQKDMPDEFAEIKYKNYIPVLSSFMQYLYGDDAGRFKFPVFSWFYRGTVYTWFLLFLMFHGVYRRSSRKVSMGVIPLFYLGTIFIGPLCQFRYMYFNVLTLPLILYMIIEKEET